MTEPSTLTSAGLFRRDAARAAVPLAGVAIEAEISGLCARVAVAHRYVNCETTPIEAVYVFPLDEGAAVSGFEAIVDGTLVVGEVQERERAFETYDEAIELGHGAFLLDEERPDVFQASIGNLPPGKEVLVRLTYVTELPVDEGRLRFTIPTTVSPRYAPAEDRVGPGRPDSEALNPPVAWTVPYGLNLAVRVTMPGRIAAIESPSHAISVSRVPDRVAGAAPASDDRSLGRRTAEADRCAQPGDAHTELIVTLAQREAALDRDFVLSIDAADLDAPQAWIECDDEGRETIAVAFVPSLPVEPTPAEIVFVVDRSGSMEGSSIEEVRHALQLCLRSMIPGCRFNIVGFGSTYEALFPESRPYDDASLGEAAGHVATLNANLGGTEILPALQFALEATAHPDLPRQIVVLTDGEVTNTDAVIALAAAHAKRARIFTFGIGAGASHHLVRGLARAGGGAAEFIYPGERIEAKVMRQFGRLLSPALADVEVEWRGGRVKQVPSKVPPVFSGSRLLLYGFVDGARPTAARLSARGPHAPLSFEVPLHGVPVTTGRVVATLAARARVRELEETSEWLTGRGSQQLERKESLVRREIIEWSLRYGLISRETSFVAVERRDTPVQGDMQLRRVPVALTTGWGGLDRRAVYVSGLSSVSAPTPVWRREFLLAPEASRSLEGRRVGAVSKLGRRARSARSRPRRPAELDALVALQGADGTWELTERLADILGRRPQTLEAALAGASGAPDDVRRAWATALALAWLQLNAADCADEWRWLGAKARKWLDGVPATPPGGGTWLDAARRFLQAEGT